ncbi:hypothetical protein PENDEC_c005G04444 [Penicillium decumbens]|uniref:Uncharacterized protein n=1 Tax=Penicillium decumbens TaxID=69771 RepID=A0A1V6PFX7_PENDC|nr:hypothetical protein PENDEC_c005G04444 [Penicillium decumbens]
MSTSVGSTFTRASAHALSYDSPSSPTSLLSASSHVDREGFLQSEHRAGGPYLCSLPAYIIGLTAEYYRRTGQHRGSSKIREDTEAILAEEEISYTSMMVTGRQSKVDPEPEPVPTVVVVTKQSSRRVAKKIHRALVQSFPSICVELINDGLLDPLRCFPVTRSESIFHKWGDICKAILRQSDISEWTTIECWRYGTSGNPTDNPVTVIVSVLKSSNNRFYTAMQRIRGILAFFKESDVAILFQKDEIKRHIENPILSKEACTMAAQPGISLGIHSSSAGSSTLGGIVELQSPHNKKWYCYGITCFHCVYAPEDHRQTLDHIQDAPKAFRQWMYSPVFPGDAMADKLLNVDHPSVSDLKRTIENANEKINGRKDAEFRRVDRLIQEREAGSDDAFVTKQEEYAHKIALNANAIDQSERDHFQKFLDDKSYVLGSVLAGSGVYRKKARNANQDFILDWALPFLYGERLPLEKFWYRRPFRQAVNSDTTFYKSGRSTFLTKGRYSELQSVHVHRVPISDDGKFRTVETFEHAFVSISGGPFSEGGDSGSFVFAEDGDVIALLWGGIERRDVTYVTPIEEVFDDIKRVTGALDVRIAEQ